MKIQVREISPEDGLSLETAINAEDLGLSPEVVLVGSGLTVRLSLERVGRMVTAACAVSGAYHLICPRCLKEFDRAKTDHFDLAVDVDKGTEAIDITEDLREEIMLANSLYGLCDPECKGLCPGCGADLNTDTCRCHVKKS